MPVEERMATAAQAIREATDQAMAADSRVFIVGEGVPDPKGIFGTTSGLLEKYGPSRVWDMPVSENGLTGACIGAALAGMKPILTHQRVDFVLLSLDQIINNAAKWHFMFGGQASVPLVIRMIMGHGWGQGAQHSQNFHSLFAHIPGLKVVMPASAYDAKGLLLAAIEDPNPVIFLEDRWVHGVKGEVPSQRYLVPLGKARLWHTGDDVTVVSLGYGTIEAARAAALLADWGLRVEVLDLRSIRPWDKAAVLTSAAKTGRLLVVDMAWPTAGMAAEIIASISEHLHGVLKAAPARLTFPDMPAPSAPALTQHYYPTYRSIAKKVFQMMGRDAAPLTRAWDQEDAAKIVPHDVPDASFTGPF